MASSSYWKRSRSCHPSPASQTHSSHQSGWIFFSTQSLHCGTHICKSINITTHAVFPFISLAFCMSSVVRPTHTHTDMQIHIRCTTKIKNEKYILACLLVSIKWKYFAVYLDVVARMSIGSRGVWAITFSYIFFSMALRWPSLVRVNVCSIGTRWWAREGQKHLRFCLRHNGAPNKRWTMQQQQTSPTTRSVFVVLW